MNSSIYQSRKYNAPITALFKRESRYLHKALYQCILSIFRFNPTFNFNGYCNLKCTQDKSHKCKQSHVIKKLLRMIYKLLSENIEFNTEI